MTNLEWAKAFVGCKLPGTGKRFQETVDVLVERLEARDQAAAMEVRERCAKSVNNHTHLVTSVWKFAVDVESEIRLLSFPTNSLAIALAKATLKEAEYWVKSHICENTRECPECGHFSMLESDLRRLEKEGNRD